VTLWGVGLGGGYHLAFRGLGGPPWGVTGMWAMQTIGLALAGLCLLAYYGRLRHTSRDARPDSA
jgi:Na+-driven multidrug efflux pump